MDIGAWWATLHRVARSWTQLKRPIPHTGRTQSLSQSNVSLVAKLWNFSAKSTCIFMKRFKWYVHIYKGTWIGGWSIELGQVYKCPSSSCLKLWESAAAASFCSFSHSDMSNSLRPHGPQHARLRCPSLSPGVCSNMDMSPLSQWCHPTISSSVTPFFCLQSFPASGSFPMSQLFASVGQSIRALHSASVLPMNIQGWFPLGLTGLISLLSKGLSRVFSSATAWNQFFDTPLSLWSNSQIHIQLLEKIWLYYFDYMDLCWQSNISAFYYIV